MVRTLRIYSNNLLGQNGQSAGKVPNSVMLGYGTPSETSKFAQVN